MPEEPSSDKSIQLRSEEVQEILSNPPIWIVRWGITLIFAFTCILVLLSFIIRYPDFVTAKVIVTTKRPTERIVARQSGGLEKLYVKNGDTVLPNQRLAVIRNSAVITDVNRLLDILDTVQFSTKGFSFPTKQLSQSMLGDIGLPYMNFEKSYVDFHLSKDLEPFTDRLADNRISLEELKIRLKDQIAQKTLLEQELQLEKMDFERHTILFEKGVISQQEYEGKKVELLQMEKNTSSMAISISQIREAIASASYALKGTRIDQQEEDVRLSANLFQSYNILKNAIRDWKYSYVLSSSIEGRLSFQEFWGENQYVNVGEVVFTVLPLDTDTLVGKLVLPSQNAGKVTLNQKVLVKLDNFPYQQYGMLVGKVNNISVSPDKEGNYFVYIRLPDGTNTSYKNKLPFDQELIGNAEIITENLSVAERVFYKFKDIFKYN